MTYHTDLDRAYRLLSLGELGEAEAACRRVLATADSNPNAWTMLGMVLRARRQFSAAEAAYRRAISLAPSNATAHHNLGALLALEERAEEALAALELAADLGLRAQPLWINRGRVLALLHRFEEAEAAYVRAVAQEPREATAQLSLVQLRYMVGDPQFARALIAATAAHPDDLALQLMLSDVQRRVGDLQGAERGLRDLILRTDGLTAARSALAVVLHEAGRLKEAMSEACAAVAASPGDRVMIENLIAIQLSLGLADEAMRLILAQRQDQPHEQRWIAYQATAARLLGLPEYRDLYDYDRLVRIYEVDPPCGWSSIEELNAALRQALGERHRFRNPPFEQSLRGGTQTARNLTMEAHPAIHAVLQAFAAPIENYRQAIGADPSHPFTARNRGAAIISGCWSVQLRQQGFHVNHIHPQGWISSAYYVSVPEEVNDTTRKAGWIKFGEPRLPVPAARAAHFVQPKAGRLVLFPSYMWHGTNPISGETPRITIAFDAVPSSSRTQG